MTNPLTNKHLIAQITNIILLIIGTICISTGCIYLIKGDVSLATTGLAAGLLLLFAATIDRFETLKGFGVEAITRELENKLGEADDAVQELRQLAELSGRTLSLIASKVGRFGGSFTFDESYMLASQIRDNLKNLKCSDAAINEALEPWVKTTASDLARKFAQTIYEEQFAAQQELHRTRDSIVNPADPNNTEYLDISSRINKIAEHMQQGNKIHIWDMNSIIDKLERHITTAPALDENVRQAHLTELHEWKPHIRALIERSEISDPKKWSELLKNDI